MFFGRRRLEVRQLIVEDVHDEDDRRVKLAMDTVQKLIDEARVTRDRARQLAASIDAVRK